MSMRVLVTRPIEDCDRTAEALAVAGHVAVVAPLFEVRALACALPSDVDVVLAASANAVRRAGPAELRALLHLPFFAVGEQTAVAAREAGFRQVRSGSGDAAGLARLVAEAAPPGAVLLHLAGRPRRDEAISALSASFRLVVAETYETVASQALPAMVVAALRDDLIDAVLHFSPRAGRVFGDLSEKSGVLLQARRLLHVFISDAARDDRFPRYHVAEHPGLESMIAAL
jgi:uroporphyrinogen-III synthase